MLNQFKRCLGFDSRINKTTGTYDQVITYVPILETLKTIFHNPELAGIFKSRHMPNKGVYADLRDATYFIESPLFSIEKD